MLRPSPNHGTQRLPNDDDDDKRAGPWMDPVSVNWKFYTVLARERKTQELPELMNIGSRKVMETV